MNLVDKNSLETSSLLSFSPDEPEMMVNIREYNSRLREQVWSLFENGMKQNSEEATESLTRRRIAILLKIAEPQFNDLDDFLCAKNGGKLFVASDVHGKVVGMLAIKRTDKDIETKSAELTRISVAREWRRKGLCRALVNHASNYVVKNFCTTRLYLITLSSVTTPMKTYAKLGFKHAGGHDIDPVDNSPQLVEFERYIVDYSDGK